MRFLLARSFCIVLALLGAGCTAGFSSQTEGIIEGDNSNGRFNSSINFTLPAGGGVSAVLFNISDEETNSPPMAAIVTFDRKAWFELQLINYQVGNAEALAYWPGGSDSYLAAGGRQIGPTTTDGGQLQMGLEYPTTRGTHALVLVGRGEVTITWAAVGSVLVGDPLLVHSSSLRDWSDAAIADEPGEFAVRRGPGMVRHRETFSVEGLGGAFIVVAQDASSPRISFQGPGVDWRYQPMSAGGLTGLRGGMPSLTLAPGNWEVEIEQTRGRGSLFGWGWSIPSFPPIEFHVEEAFTL